MSHLIEFAHAIFGRGAHAGDVNKVSENTTMLERRRAERVLINDAGIISLDEHTTIPCVVYDLSDTGVRLTMMSTNGVPDSFLLQASCFGSGVCEVAWRTEESIGARLTRLDRW
ncbi:hypothetical protein P8609_18640 [Lysobacter sp. UC]|uniref:PilZ domain-containing protein n=1 Tax=Lysobacter arvi TaxID=3038776 RepID=A0ABU1CJ39_9GAMM|nr:hypothetical protein [Lysobacter arvi]